MVYSLCVKNIFRTPFFPGQTSNGRVFASNAFKTNLIRVVYTRNTYVKPNVFVISVRDVPVGVLPAGGSRRGFPVRKPGTGGIHY